MSFSLEVLIWYYGVVCRHEGEGYFVLVGALGMQLVEKLPSNSIKDVLTRGSAIWPGVCVWTTRSTNLRQHIRTPGISESILRRILDLMAAMVCHGWESFGLRMLRTRAGQR